MISNQTKLKAVCRIAVLHKRQVGFIDNHMCTKCGENRGGERVTWVGRGKYKKVICIRCFCEYHLVALKKATKKIHKRQYRR